MIASLCLGEISSAVVNASLIHKTLFVWVIFLAVPLLKERVSMLQSIGVIATVFYAAVMTTIILIVVHLLVGLRVVGDDEEQGLDLSQHGEQVL